MTPEQARKEEREAIVEWLCERSLRDPKSEWPFWKLILWGVFNPLRLRSLRDRVEFVLETALAITRGDHREGKDGK